MLVVPSRLLGRQSGRAITNIFRVEPARWATGATGKQTIASSFVAGYVRGIRVLPITSMLICVSLPNQDASACLSHCARALLLISAEMWLEAYMRVALSARSEGTDWYDACDVAQMKCLPVCWWTRATRKCGKRRMLSIAITLLLRQCVAGNSRVGLCKMG